MLTHIAIETILIASMEVRLQSHPPDSTMFG